MKLRALVNELRFIAYKICYVNLSPWENVHNSLEVSQPTFEYHSALPPQSRY